jgi:hypothetical protein
MTKAAQQLLSNFNALPKTAQKEVLLTLLRLPLEVSYSVPSEEQLRHTAEAIFLELDHRESQS